jgi:hypothetical protein
MTTRLVEKVIINDRTYFRFSYDSGRFSYYVRRSNGRQMMLDARHTKIIGRIDKALAKPLITV